MLATFEDLRVTGKWGAKKITGTLGSGNGTLRASTVSGSIALLRRPASEEASDAADAPAAEKAPEASGAPNTSDVPDASDAQDAAPAESKDL